MSVLRRAFQERPLLAILLLAAVLRITAAIFSRGFLTIDDHHVLIDTADGLATGIPLPSDYKRSILYPGSVALIMKAVRALANASPDIEMLVVRLVHAGIATLTVYCAFRILERAAGREAAITGGLLVATFFALPVTSAHQFEEAVCQVPMLAACWWIVAADGAERGAGLRSFLAGAATVTTLLLRFPALPFVLSFAAFALWRPAQRFSKLHFALGLLAVVALQAASSAVINGDPAYYFLRTAGHRAGLGGGYPTGPIWKYLLTLVAVFLPPFSVLLLAAAIRGGRAFPLLGVPTLVFLIGHSIIPNKQERFLLPVLPALLILGAIGMPVVREWFARRGWTRAYRWSWGYFAALNGLLLIAGLFSYGKKDRVAPLVYVQARHDATGVVVAQYTYTFHVPVYYLGRPRPRVFVFSDRTRLAQDVQTVRAASPAPNYLILYSDSADADAALLERALGARLERDATITPSLGDELAHLVNPARNRASRAVVLSIMSVSGASH